MGTKQNAPETLSSEERIGGLERAFALDDRLLKLEAKIQERVPQAKVYELDSTIAELSRELTIPSPKPGCY